MSRNISSFSNSTASSNTLDAAGAGIVGGYDGNSFTLQVLIIFFPALAMYNVIELVTLIFVTFTKFQGLYFWSLLISSLGIIPYSLGFLFKFNNITEGSARWFSVVLLTVGWYAMVTGQSVVLWSRLHLIVSGVKGERTLTWTKWMIIINAFILHIPTTVLTFGSNGDLNLESFVRGYGIMEKIQMSGFFVQEVILSSIYIAATVRILRTSIRDDTKRIMYQLFVINVLIIVMDLALLGMEAASLYLLETTTKGVFYSVKLKLEFAILGKLVQFVGRPGTSIANDRRLSAQFPDVHTMEKESSRSSSNRGEGPTGIDAGDISDYVDLTKAGRNGPRKESLTNAERSRKSSIRLRPGVSAVDAELALFQHTDDAVLPETVDIDPRDVKQAASEKDISTSPVRQRSRIENV